MNLRQKVVSAFLWSAGSRLATQIVSWVITIFVIRLLTPDDYGLLTMAHIFVTFVILLSEAGLSAALIQARELDDSSLRTIFGLAILVHSALFIVLVAAAPAIAMFFDEQRLVAIVRILALQLLIGIFAIIPGALLARRLEFKKQSLLGVVSALCGSLTTLVLAFLGFGVWALVVGSLITHSLNTAGINVLCPFIGWPDFSLRNGRALMLFGGQVTGSRILWMLYSQADMLIAGKALGKEALGVYSLSMYLASLPLQKISGIINQVALPAFARSQHDTALVARYLLKALRIQCLVSFPVLWGISALAPEIVEVLLGKQWQLATLPLQLLPIIMPLTMIGLFLNTAFHGIGKGGVVFNNVATTCVVMPIAFWTGAHWGIAGVAFAWLLGFPFVFLMNLRRMLPIIDLSIWNFLVQMIPAASAGAAMYVAVIVTRILVDGRLDGPVSMSALILVGAGAYGLITYSINREGIREMVELFLPVRSYNKP